MDHGFLTNCVYNVTPKLRAPSEWHVLLEELLTDLASHLGVDLRATEYFIESQLKDEQSFGCHVDFRGSLSPSLSLEVCGLLCYQINWGESIQVGAFLLIFQKGKRLYGSTQQDSVTYLARHLEGWQEPHVELGHGDEWTAYETTQRWDGGSRPKTFVFD